MTRLTHETLEQRRAHAAARLRNLLEEVATGGTPRAVEFADARAALDALPLSTAEAATAWNRLENARRYLQDRERGAACYELRLLALDLTNE